MDNGHARRLLVGEQARGLDLAGDEVAVHAGVDGAVGLQSEENDVGVGLDLREDHGLGCLDDQNDLGVGKELTGADHEVEIALVGRRRGSALVGAVLARAVLVEVAADRGVARVIRGVGTVLQRDGQEGVGLHELGHHVVAAHVAVHRIGGVGDEEEGVLAASKVLGRGADDVGRLVAGLFGDGLLGSGEAEGRGLAGGLADLIGHDLEGGVGNVLGDRQGESGGDGGEH